MGVTPGSRLGPYDVGAQIGAGGMGEVYRARDTNLDRQVAIKILPDALAQDPERLARFEREAKTLASLNHPNIAIIHGLEKADGIRALVMELVDGDTLADRIARGPIVLNEALAIARQIAEALEAAHEQGIIHRDLKPANIKVRPDGTVKVLDFGLAKALESPAVSALDASASPTITSPALMTGVGVLLGTAAYMSPEQAKGRAADKRSDVWAFGCVLYEMLTGKRCFHGEDVADTLAFVLTKEPDWDALQANTPPSICNLLRRCLDKDRRKRIGDVAAALFAIDESETLNTAGTRGASSITARPIPLWRRLAVYSVPALISGTMVGAGVWFVTRPPAPRVIRSTIVPPPEAAFSGNDVERSLTITPDGLRVVYVGANGTQLFVRGLDALEAMPLFRGAPRAPFVSPDGQWVGFVDSAFTLKKVAMTGGPAVTIAQANGGGRGASWLPDDTIVFANGVAVEGLQRVSASGGMPIELTRPDRGKGEVDHLWPEALPGGRGVLFTITTAGGLGAAQIAVLDLQTGSRKVLVRGGTHAQYVATGHLVYAAAGTLMAVVFDLDRMETHGTPMPVVPEVATSGFGAVSASVAIEGTLAYITGAGSGGGAARTLVWVDRQGQEVPIGAPARAYLYPRLSPDGTRVAIFVADQEQDVWIWDLRRSTLTRLTFDPSLDTYPMWTPDGRRLIFASEQTGVRNIFSRAADGTGAVKRLTESPNLQNVTAVSPDGTQLMFTELMPPKTGFDLMLLQLVGASPSRSAGRGGPIEPARVTALVQTPFAEQNGIISPDGRWLAYEADNSGQLEVYVRPFPDVNTGTWQVSTAGGTRPLWARNGEELFYLSPIGRLMRVGVERGVSWTATTPSMLLKEAGGYYTNPAGNFGRTYDISPDGRRFLMIKVAGAEAGIAPPSIVVVQHFDEELKRLVPVN